MAGQKTGLWLGCLLWWTLTGAWAAPAQHALVVGIDHYRHGGTQKLVNLKGAANDARLIADALRAAGVRLPDSRLLLDGRATLAGFRAAWADLLAEAAPGDSLIVTYAGHGGQENEFAPPLDERGPGGDGMDETLMFHDFDPDNPRRGRINDDQLRDLFAQAAEYELLFVVDACHSGGLRRSIERSPLPSRANPRPWHIPVARPSLQAALAEHSDDEPFPPHVTLVSATNKDSLKVDEIYLGGQPHGALSWYFAEAVRGGADQNGDGALTRRELGQYLVERVSTQMNRLQQPELEPRGGAETPVVRVGRSAPAQTTQVQAPLRVRVEGGALPTGLTGAQEVNGGAYSLRVRITDGRAVPFNHTGDRLNDGFPIADLAAWQRVLDKYRLLQALAGAYNIKAAPARIRLGVCKPGQGGDACEQSGDGRHGLGQRVEFTFRPAAGSGMTSFTLFDLAGDGSLQFLYPLTGVGDPPQPPFPYRLPLKVTCPVGGDDLVAVFCREVPRELNALLAYADGRNAPDPAVLLDRLPRQNCQLGRYAFFTEADPGKPCTRP